MTCGISTSCPVSIVTTVLCFMFTRLSVDIYYIATYQNSAMSSTTPALDPEAFVQCPYEENHKVRNQRLQIHLVQCRRVSLKASVFSFYLNTILQSCFSSMNVSCHMWPHWSDNPPGRPMAWWISPWRSLSLFFVFCRDTVPFKCVDAGSIDHPLVLLILSINYPVWEKNS